MFCTNCGATISDDAKFCPHCGVDLEEIIEIIKEVPSTSDISIAESDFKIFLEGDAKSVYVVTKISNEFNIIVHNTSPYSIPDIKVQLSGSDLVEVISGHNSYGTILSGQKVSTSFIILPKYLGSFTLNAKLQSGVGHSLTFPIEVRVKTAEDLRVLKTTEKDTRVPIAPVKDSKIASTSSRPPLSANQALAPFIIVALVGLILMIGGITSLIKGGLTFNTGITMIIIGFILLIIGSKGQCCIFPCAMACDGCGDCDCDC